MIYGVDKKPQIFRIDDTCENSLFLHSITIAECLKYKIDKKKNTYPQLNMSHKGSFTINCCAIEVRGISQCNKHILIPHWLSYSAIG